MPGLALAILTWGAFVIGTELFVVAGLLPGLASDFAITTALAGQSVTAFGLAYAVGAPVLANLLARFRRRTILGWSLAAFAAVNLATALAPTFPALLVLRVLSAGAACLFLPNAAALTAELSTPDVRGRNLGVVMGGLGAATVLGVPLGIVVGDAWGWRSVFVLVAALSVFGVALTRCLPPGSPGRRMTWKASVIPLAQPTVGATLALTVAVITGGFASYTYLSVVLKAPLGWSSAAFSGALALYGALGLVGSVLGGKAADRWGSTAALRLTLGLLTVAFAALGWPAAVSAAWWAVLAVWGLAGNAFTPIQQHRLLEASPGNPGILGLNSSAVYLGQTLGAGLGGVVLTLAGAAALPWASAALIAALWVVTWLTPPRHEGSNLGEQSEARRIAARVNLTPDPAPPHEPAPTSEAPLVSASPAEPAGERSEARRLTGAGVRRSG